MLTQWRLPSHLQAGGRAKGHPPTTRASLLQLCQGAEVGVGKGGQKDLASPLATHQEQETFGVCL